MIIHVAVHTCFRHRLGVTVHLRASYPLIGDHKILPQGVAGLTRQGLMCTQERITRLLMRKQILRKGLVKLMPPLCEMTRFTGQLHRDSSLAGRDSAIHTAIRTAIHTAIRDSAIHTAIRTAINPKNIQPPLMHILVAIFTTFKRKPLKLYDLHKLFIHLLHNSGMATLTSHICVKPRQLKPCPVVVKTANIRPLLGSMAGCTRLICKLISVYGLFQMAARTRFIQPQKCIVRSHKPESLLIIQHGLIPDPVPVSVAVLTHGILVGAR